MRCVIRFALAVLMIVVITGTESAQAAFFGPLDLVRSSTGAVLQDNFESPAVGNAPNNGALAGTWSVTNSNPTNVVQIWDASQPPNLAAEEGSQYANINRIVDGSVHLTGAFSSSITSGTMDGRYKLYIPSGTFPPGFGSTITFDQNGNQYTIAFLVDNAGLVKRYNGTSYVATTVPYTQGIWQDWEINANLATQTYTLRVGGFSETGLPFNLANGGNGTFSQILFAPAGQPVQMFVDQIPEPATLTTLAAGALLVLKRRRTRPSR